MRCSLEPWEPHRRTTLSVITEGASMAGPELGKEGVEDFLGMTSVFLHLP